MLAELRGNLETNGMRSARGSGKPAPSRALSFTACSWCPQASLRNLGAYPLSRTSTPQGNLRSPPFCPLPQAGLPWEAPGVGGGGLWPLLVNSGKTSPTTGVTYHLFCSKSKDVLWQEGPADRWVGIPRSAAAPSRPAAGREAPPPRRSRRARRQPKPPVSAGTRPPRFSRPCSLPPADPASRSVSALSPGRQKLR